MHNLERVTVRDYISEEFEEQKVRLILTGNEEIYLVCRFLPMKLPIVP